MSPPPLSYPAGYKTGPICKHCGSDGKGFWHSGAQLGWKRTLAVESQGTGHSKRSSLQPCSRDRFPSVTALLGQERASPTKLLQLRCSAPFSSVTTLSARGRFPQRKCYSPAQIPSLWLPPQSSNNSFSALAEGLHSNLTQEIYWEGRTQESGCLCQSA